MNLNSCFSKVTGCLDTVKLEHCCNILNNKLWVVPTLGRCVHWLFIRQSTFMSSSVDTRLDALCTLSYSSWQFYKVGIIIPITSEETKANWVVVTHQKPFGFKEAELGFKPKSVYVYSTCTTVPCCLIWRANQRLSQIWKNSYGQSGEKWSLLS